MKKFFLAALLLFCVPFFGQTDSQTRYNSDFRQFYMWNEERQTYELRDTEYEHSVIDIREINARNNGYVAISMTDDAKTRMYHGTITGFKKDDAETTWALRSKILKSKLVLNTKENTVTYSYEADQERQRYMKIFVFRLSDN